MEFVCFPFACGSVTILFRWPQVRYNLLSTGPGITLYALLCLCSCPTLRLSVSEPRVAKPRLLASAKTKLSLIGYIIAV